MTGSSEAIESYLDQLQTRLGGSPREVRRLLAEAESHLYDGLAAGLARGLDQQQAEQEAIARFGSAATVATAYDGARRLSLVRFGRLLAQQLVPVTVTGLLAIGVSGLLARLTVAVWGSGFGFADAPGTRYPAGACRYWLAIHPGSGSCARAELAEAVSDGLQYRYAAGLLGLVLLAGLWLWRRRRGPLPQVVPVMLLDALAAASFLAVAVAATAAAADRWRVAAGNGVGQWLSVAIVSWPLGLWYGRRLLAAARATASPDPLRTG